MNNSTSIHILVLCVPIFLAGCSDSLDPISGSGSYSVYGNLSSQEGRHFFRVRPLDQPLGKVSVDSLSATVTLTNQSSGVTRRLRDSIIVFDGVRTHNYWLKFKAEPSTTYEIRVEGPGKPATTAQATTPTATDAAIVLDRNDCKTPLQTPSPPSTMIEVRFLEAEAPFDEISVGFRWEGEKHWVTREGLEAVRGKQYKVVRFSVRPTLTEIIPGASLDDPTPACAKLDDSTLEISYLYTNPERKGGDTDLQTGFDPTRQERVRNGLGFFGAFRRDTLSVKVDTSFSFDL